MRTIWLIFGGLLLLLLGLQFLLPRPAPATGREVAAPIVLVAGRAASPAVPSAGRRDSVVRFALRQVGTPYVWAGTSPATGFDCSGFITYVFGHFGVATPHATALLINAGRPIPRAQAQPGDIVVFTGTAEGSTTAGHAGIVISALGEMPLRFVHASSARRESGVKISQVENSGYERRFMQVRRVLAGGEVASAEAVATRRPAVPLPARVAPLPTRLRPRPRATAKAAVATRRHVATKPTTDKKPATATRKAAVKKPAPRARKAMTRTRRRAVASPANVNKR